ncbi:MAG: hypothetical protein AAF471_04450 [Myxococcota bacterium]
MPSLAISLLQAVKSCFQANKGKIEESGDDTFYQTCAKLSLHMEKLRKAGLNALEVSRVNQYLKNVIVEFEKMRNIACYRTPLSLRAYSKIFLHAFPIVFAPHFAHLSQDYSMPSGFLSEFERIAKR